jgi:hypothetical protein
VGEELAGEAAPEVVAGCPGAVREAGLHDNLSYVVEGVEFRGAKRHAAEKKASVWSTVELRSNDEVREGLLQSWLKNAWVYPMQGPGEQTFLRLTPGGRLKMRRRIGELEKALDVSGADLAKQEEAGTLPAEPEKMELAIMVQAYTSERRFIASQGQALGSAAIAVDEVPEVTTEVPSEQG